VPPPKYPVQRLVPNVEIADGAKLGGLFVIQRGSDGFEWLEEEDALEILLGNCEDAYGFPPYHAIEDFLLGSAADNLREVERQILAGAFEGVSAALLSSTSLDWAVRIPALVDQLPQPSEPGGAIVGNGAGHIAGNRAGHIAGNGAGHIAGNRAGHIAGNGAGHIAGNGAGPVATDPAPAQHDSEPVVSQTDGATR
jgi:hypothetical protein